MPSTWTLAAPDLRGRGHSRDLPGPYGLDRHVADVTAVLRHFGGRPVLAGHSMGAYAALLTRDAHPSLVRRLVLVDGGLPRPVPDGADPEASLEATLGPAMTRLQRTYADTDAYLDFWRAHPALAGHWTPDVEAYARYDVIGEPGHMRARAIEDAVRADTRDIVTEKPFADALGHLTRPTPLLTAPDGLMGEPPGFQPPDLVATWQERAPQLRPVLVPDVNHYTIMYEGQGAAAVARAITTRAV